jgi:hypothetical protein
MQVHARATITTTGNQHVVTNTGTQLHRAHSVTELSRDLKQAVAKAKKKRLKQAAGSPQHSFF